MAFGGATEFCLIAEGNIGLGIGYNPALSTGFGMGCGQIALRVSSDESTDFAGVTGYFPGIGMNPVYNAPLIVGASSMPLGLFLGAVVIHIESTVGPRPGRVTLHSVLRSTANFSTASYKSTGGWDLTLSSASTA